MGFNEVRVTPKRLYTVFQSKIGSNLTQTRGFTYTNVGSIRWRENNPNYRKQIANGSSAGTYYKNDRFSSYLVRGHMYALGKPGTPRHGDWDYTDACTYIDPRNDTIYNWNNLNRDRAIQDALISAYRKARAVQVDYSGQTIIGELRETVKMLRSPFQSLRKEMQNFLKKNSGVAAKARKGSKRHAKTLSDTWLEFSFGVQPLLNDIHDVVESLNNIRLGAVRRVRGIADVKGGGARRTGLNTGGWMFWYWDEVIRNSIQVLFVLGVKEQVTSNERAYKRALENGGFTLAEVVPAAWELVPWSFLVDYFTNIGDVLEASAFSVSNLAWSSSTITYRITVDIVNCQPDCSGKSNYQIGSWVPIQGHAERTVIERQPSWLPSINAIQAVRLEMPGLGPKWTNMAALVGSRGAFSR